MKNKVMTNNDAKPNPIDKEDTKDKDTEESVKVKNVKTTKPWLIIQGQNTKAKKINAKTYSKR